MRDRDVLGLAADAGVELSAEQVAELRAVDPGEFDYWAEGARAPGPGLAAWRVAHDLPPERDPVDLPPEAR